ncbi:hypothetical protein EVAR_71913_1 [Eumeta japonica]|uniref:Uncharacterized protein n=1 Tax=Eumeta variegata TaxID=151549 RepID=A0A4C1SG47_EUMVA|nr:hypothetical protein EVAR_71913_1 [Eumeta japonica]
MSGIASSSPTRNQQQSIIYHHTVGMVPKYAGHVPGPLQWALCAASRRVGQAGKLLWISSAWNQSEYLWEVLKVISLVTSIGKVRRNGVNWAHVTLAALIRRKTDYATRSSSKAGISRLLGVMTTLIDRRAFG